MSFPWYHYMMYGIQSLNNSTFFAGLMMIFMNVGSKYITIELSKTQEQYLQHSFARQLLLFAIVWFATKDIFISLILTASFIIMADHLFNENSRFCIIPEKWRPIYEFADLNNDGQVSEQELAQAIHILEKAKQDYRRKEQTSMLQQLQAYQEVSM